jgi:hypothetical protein
MLVVAACSLARPTSSAAGGNPAGATGDSSTARGWLAGRWAPACRGGACVPVLNEGGGGRPAGVHGREMPGTELCLHRAREGRPGGREHEEMLRT